MAPQLGSKAEGHCAAAAGKSQMHMSVPTEESSGGENGVTFCASKHDCGFLFDGEMKKY